MSAAVGDDVEFEAPASEPLGLAPDVVEVRRNAGLAALIGAVASTVGIAYLARASGTGAVLDWVLASTMGLLGVAHLAAFVDARTPLLVADTQGVRIRLGRTWRGLPWGALSQVEHRPRRGALKDGRLVLVTRNPERVLAELDRSGRRQSQLSQKLYGAPFAVPLALSTRVSGAGDDLTGAMARLAGDSARVVEESPDGSEVTPRRRRRDPRPAIAHGIGSVAARLQRHRGDADSHEHTGPAAAPPMVASATPSPLRDPVSATRAELRRPSIVDMVEDTQVWGDRVSPIARPGNAVDPLLIDDCAVEPADDPVVGPQFVAARTRLGLSVDQLAERTRIRPHVIESIEVDDFVPCGGDFYTRGHLRTLARVLGIDAVPLLASYDDRYADAPINPRRVFEAELAKGSLGSIRGTRGGPNWSVLVAVVMALVLAWSIARLIMDSPVELRGTAPVLNGSAGVGNGSQQIADPVPVLLSASGGGAHVVVRDGAGRVVFNGELAFGETKTMRISPPVRVQSSDGSLETTVAGEPRGALGATGRPAQNTFPVG